jgi:hypothetical protein
VPQGGEREGQGEEVVELPSLELDEEGNGAQPLLCRLAKVERTK